MRVGVLVSGQGTNLGALIAARDAGTLAPAELAVVVSNVPDAGALDRAGAAGIAKTVVDHRGLSREAFETKLVDVLAAHQVEAVVLAGFMRVIKPGFLNAFAGKIINLHPSLLPSFPGLDGIGQAFRRGVKVTGCTVHFVTAEVDGGPIIDQAVVRIEKADTLESLAEKVHAAEHALLPAVIARLSEGR